MKALKEAVKEGNIEQEEALAPYLYERHTTIKNNSDDMLNFQKTVKDGLDAVEEQIRQKSPRVNLSISVSLMPVLRCLKEETPPRASRENLNPYRFDSNPLLITDASRAVLQQKKRKAPTAADEAEESD